ncbi:N-acetyl-gamma-glutamyl-phosphate reductase [Arenicella chitinivorans]|uniref:N-acetyl-gamma-glutamyl-phosphate reductase n=1 Tax=Arenicella chitinivorans TaxID=1329800 RepID=A0A918RT43_9GAMM|nr:N-acetyl-gamma-glutamyl-phosphate reductase [Arenicella chitinivorans]
MIGGTGYTGVELLRLLATHSAASLGVITSRSEAGTPVSDLYPSLRGSVDLNFTVPDATALAQCDVVFSATPNGIAMTHARDLLDQGVKLIDLAADFRIKDIPTWEHWYGMTHVCPDLVAGAVYGLPELNRSVIAQAKLVANPGCYPTATTLGLLPLFEGARGDDVALVDASTLVVDAKSGVTGAGRSAKVANLFSEVADSFKAYGAAGHRHHPEIWQNISSVTQQAVGLTFIPHLLPMLRGIHATIYADLLDSAQPLEAIHERFTNYYSNEPFVDILPLGQHPETRSVKSSNVCRIAIHKAVGSNKLVVLSVIDNLTKGAAGQAVQNMNIMFGLDETEGLSSPAIMP